MTAELELLSHGREPDRPPRRLGHIGHAGRVALAATTAGLALVAGALWWQTGTGTSAAADAATAARSAALAFTPAPPPLTPRFQQIRISTTDQEAYVPSRGYVDLRLQLVNDGDQPLKLLSARLPQPGVRADPGPGGLVADSTSTVLEPGTPTPYTLHLFVACPQGLSGAAVDHIDLTLDDSQGRSRSASLDLRPLPGFWDRVRRTSCSADGAGTSTVPLVVQAMPTSVRWQGGTTSG